MGAWILCWASYTKHHGRANGKHVIGLKFKSTAKVDRVLDRRINVRFG